MRVLIISALMLSLAIFEANGFSFFETNYSKIKFHSPVSIPMVLTGNFGEFRSAHFHTGIDIKTNNTKILSVEDGYVSRVYISPVGYGKAIFITHRNGFTSVYGHVERFAPTIDSMVKALQYRKEKFEGDFTFTANEYPVKKGEFIAVSGNTGSSGGPHLHFEIRETSSEKIINPLLFPFDIKDNVAPKLNGVAIYPIENRGVVNGRSKKIYLATQISNGSNKFVSPQTLKVWGDIGFGAVATEYLSGGSNPCGIFSLELYFDNNLIFRNEMKKLSFDRLKYISSYLDYSEQIAYKRDIQKCFVADPNNKVETYGDIEDDGIVHIDREGKFNVKVVVADVAGNKSIFNFTVIGAKQNIQNVEPPKNSELVYWNRSKQLDYGNLAIKFEPEALFNSIYFTIDSSKKEGYKNKIYHIHDSKTALCKPITLTFATRNYEKSNRYYLSKLEQGVQKQAITGRIEGGLFIAQIKQFGSYVVVEDINRPTIESVDIKGAGQVIKGGKIRFKIVDNGSGIKNYFGKIDDKWALFEYDEKTNTIAYEIDKTRLSKGKKHSIEITVTDHVGFTNQFKSSFTW